MSTEIPAFSRSLRALIRRYERMVYAVAVRYGLDEADLDEVLQDVRVRLWKSVSTPEEIDATSSSYLYRAATSAAVDFIRRRRARARDVVLDGALPTGKGAAPDAILEQSELGAEIQSALTTLSESRRPVVRMHLLGYPREEIASLLGWSEAKTRNLLYRGLEDLRQELTRRGITPAGGGPWT